MPASLIEAFGDCQSQNSSTTSNMKKRKNKNQSHNQNRVSVSEYGHTIPDRKYLEPSTSSSPRKLNQNSAPEVEPTFYNDDDQYLNINDSEYGPTDYNIKPSDVNDYNKYNQFDFDFSKEPEQMTDATNYIVDQNSVFRPSSEKQNSQPESMNMNTTKQQNSMSKTISTTATDARIQELNNKIDLILQKLGHFEEPTQENIHDIILFVIFGLFVIFILDSVYRVGKMTI